MVPYPQLGGYIATFDLRDPGTYTLQISLGWFFGNGDVYTYPRVVLVGRVGQSMSYCNFRRSLIGEGGVLPIAVTLSAEAITAEQQRTRFGWERCSGAGTSAVGRWVQYGSVGGVLRECEAPYCSGDIQRSLSGDPVSLGL